MRNMGFLPSIYGVAISAHHLLNAHLLRRLGKQRWANDKQPPPLRPSSEEIKSSFPPRPFVQGQRQMQVTQMMVRA